MEDMKLLYSSINNKGKNFFKLNKSKTKTNDELSLIQFSVKTASILEKYNINNNGELKRLEYIDDTRKFISNISGTNFDIKGSGGKIVSLDVTTEIKSVGNTENNSFEIDTSIAIPEINITNNDNNTESGSIQISGPAKFRQLNNINNFSFLLNYQSSKEFTSESLNISELESYNNESHINIKSLNLLYVDDELMARKLNIYNPNNVKYTDKLPHLNSDNNILILLDNKSNLSSYIENGKTLYKLTIKKDINETNKENQCFFEGTSGKIYKEVEYSKTGMNCGFEKVGNTIEIYCNKLVEEA